MKSSDRTLARLIQVSTIVLVLGLGAAAAALAWVAIELHGLSGDIAQSRSRLPSRVQAVLPAGTDILDNPQVTLVRYSSGISSGAAVLFSTVPGRDLAAFLTLPPSTGLRGTTLAHLSNPDAIHALRTSGIRVSHVALVDPKNLGPLIDGIGGITVANPTPFVVTTPSGQQVRFDRGTVQLDGQRAALFVQAATTREQLETASVAVLSGIVHAALAPSGFERLQSIGSSFAHSASTDLTDADVLGLVDLRLRGGVVLECTAQRRTEFSNPVDRAAVKQFLGQTTAFAAPCRARHLERAGLTPPTAVVRIVQHYGWSLFALGALLLAVLAATAAAVLAVRWPRPQPRRESAWPPLTIPPSSADVQPDVVWSGAQTATGDPPAPPETIDARTDDAQQAQPELESR